MCEIPKTLLLQLAWHVMYFGPKWFNCHIIYEMIYFFRVRQKFFSILKINDVTQHICGQFIRKAFPYLCVQSSKKRGETLLIALVKKMTVGIHLTGKSINSESNRYWILTPTSCSGLRQERIAPWVKRWYGCLPIPNKVRIIE